VKLREKGKRMDVRSFEEKWSGLGCGKNIKWFGNCEKCRRKEE
jgi:hypothetical protein